MSCAQPTQVPVPVNLIATSSLILYIGSHRSLRMRDKTSVEAGEVRKYDHSVSFLSYLLC